jgi:hypothetical protein
MAQPLQIELELHPAPEMDAEAHGELARQLRRQLVELETDRVNFTGPNAAPPGAKGDPVLIHLAVTLAPTAITGVIQGVQAWLLRHKSTTITVESGGRKLTLTGDISEQQRALVDDFLKQHES